MLTPPLSHRYNILHPKKHPKRILIHGIRFVMTMNGQDRLVVQKDMSLLIENETIVKIFPKNALHTEINLDTIDLIYDGDQKGGIALTPGFINMHAHPPMYLLRSSLTLAEPNLAKALSGMARLERLMDEEDYTLGAIGDFTEEQKAGITTTLSHYAVFDPIEKAAIATRQHVIHCVSAASNTHPENSPKLVESYLKKKNTYTTPGIALHYVWKATPTTLRAIQKIQKKYQVYLTLHVAESEETVGNCLRLFGERPIGVLSRYGLLNSRTIMSHGVHLTEEEILAIKKARAIVVHLPTSNLLHRSGFFNYQAFKKVGAEHLVTLGTDSVVSKNRLDLLTEALTMKTLHQASTIVSYEDLFDMVTARPARLLGLSKLGKILPGYTANLSFWKLKDRGFMPYDERRPKTLVSNMITHGSRDVRDLMIRGVFVVSDRRHCFVNESKLLENLQKAHMKLRGKTSKK